MSHKSSTISISENIRAAQDLLKQCGVPHISRKAQLLIQPCLGVGGTPAQDDEIPIGASKFGGRADLSERLLASISDEKLNPMSMEFIAQINFADLQRFDIELGVPKSGLLSIFALNLDQVLGKHFDDRDRCGVILYTPFEPAYNDLARTSGGSFPVEKLAFFESLTIPGLNSRFGLQLDLHGAEEERVYEECYETIFESLGGPVGGQIGGFPFSWQNDDEFPPYCTPVWNQMSQAKFHVEEQYDHTVIRLPINLAYQFLAWIPNGELRAGVVQDALLQYQFD